jgi:hypothetical protein
VQKSYQKHNCTIQSIGREILVVVRNRLSHASRGPVTARAFIVTLPHFKIGATVMIPEPHHLNRMQQPLPSTPGISTKMPRSGRKRKHEEDSETPTRMLQPRRKPKYEEDPDTSPSQSPKSQSVVHDKAPHSPEASFSALPTELRLQIYSYLCDATLIHVHRHKKESPEGTDRFTWTPCRSPNTAFPVLCANPKVSIKL